MTIERLGGSDHTQPQRPARTGPVKPPAAPETGRIGTDGARFTTAARDNTDVHHDLVNYPVAKAPGEHHGEAHPEASALDDLAHKAHNPHGALHVVEAGEQGIHVAARIVGRASRGAGVAAEITHAGGDGHHGILAKAEHAVEGAFKATTRWLGNLVRLVPGGGKALDSLGKVWRVPGRVMGPGVDAALKGTRLGGAVTMTGSGARMTGAMGGRLPIIGAVFGAIIAVSDVKSSARILADKHATPMEKTIAGVQGALSLGSGVVGVGALGAAAGVAFLGLTAPFSIPAALGLAAVLGTGAFVLTFFKKATHS